MIFDVIQIIIAVITVFVYRVFVSFCDYDSRQPYSIQSQQKTKVYPDEFWIIIEILALFLLFVKAEGLVRPEVSTISVTSTLIALGITVIWLVICIFLAKPIAKSLYEKQKELHEVLKEGNDDSKNDKQ